MTLIRELLPGRDTARVRRLYDRAADYLALESGEAPDAATVEEFFAIPPFVTDPAGCLKLGLFNGGRLDAIADLAFGFPEAGDAFIGLLLIAADQRGRGLGHAFVDHMVDIARARQAPRIFAAVLEANPRGRAFWEREGFFEVLKTPPRRYGKLTHVCHRMERRL